LDGALQVQEENHLDFEIFQRPVMQIILLGHLPHLCGHQFLNIFLHSCRCSRREMNGEREVSQIQEERGKGKRHTRQRIFSVHIRQGINPDLFLNQTGGHCNVLHFTTTKEEEEEDTFERRRREKIRQQPTMAIRALRLLFSSPGLPHP